jgi:peroxidase
MINPILERLDVNFQQIPEGNLPLRKAFFAPWRLVQEGGVDPILRGFFATPAKMNLPNEVSSNGKE